MKTRYCSTVMNNLIPCQVGWGSAGGNEVASCSDLPMEENCRNIVDVEVSTKIGFCPICGAALDIKKE
jgi:hypothetical protein